MARYRAAFGEDMNKLVDLFDSMLEVRDIYAKILICGGTSCQRT
jgi:hypothetical protein